MLATCGGPLAGAEGPVGYWASTQSTQTQEFRQESGTRNQIQISGQPDPSSWFLSHARRQEYTLKASLGVGVGEATVVPDGPSVNFRSESTALCGSLCVHLLTSKTPLRQESRRCSGISSDFPMAGISRLIAAH